MKQLDRDTKNNIREDAEKARAEGKSPNDACPWPFQSAEAMHWVACWATAGFQFDPEGVDE